MVSQRRGIGSIIKLLKWNRGSGMVISLNTAPRKPPEFCEITLDQLLNTMYNFLRALGV